ncbi:hypothetical protein G6R40_09640 [Chryseobacterium sp. POL2]|uniref:hypothetical protein n=1 Tax=Chryseobacterium sp. POL2 TaxID=2713414 RepID=UPI0013E1EB37|nr:hypothetical protein [Chryseobacterium sp. POL2]QIG89906.1 hypothetical protein G6R40_09640 [Chryseobacterium sp. POL2]
MKKIIIIGITLCSLSVFSQKSKQKTKQNTKKTFAQNSNNLTEAELQVLQFRKDNPEFYKNHKEGLSESLVRSNIDYSNLNGKNCSEIAEKENWSKWTLPSNADARCSKYLKMKKIKKIAIYPLN